MRVDGRGNIAGVTRSGQHAGAAAKGGGGGAGRRRTPARAPAPANTDSDSDSDTSKDLDDASSSDDSIQDYLQNVADASDSDSDGSARAVGARRGPATRRQLEVLRRFSGVELGHEGAPEDVGWMSEDGDDDDASSSDGGSASSFSSGEAEEGAGPAAAQAEGNPGLSLEEIQGLAPELRYPVSVRPRAPPPPPPPPGKKGKGRAADKKGGKRGKLAPGEKAQLRRQGVEARRAARAAARGFDLAGAHSQLREMVAAGRDAHAFPPMGKHECQQVCRLAALFGCKAGAQGTGKRRMVVVLATNRTALPAGDAFLTVGRMLAAGNAAALGGAFPAPSHVAHAADGSPGAGRWAAAAQQLGRGGRGGDKKGPTGAKPRRDHVWGGPGGAEGFNGPPPPKRKHTKPVAFVSSGVIVDPAEGGVEVVLASRAEPGRRAASEEAAHGRAAPAPTAAPPAAAAGQQLLLDVFEEGGSGSDADGAGGMSEDEARGRVGLGGRGAAAAEGITNPGRLLGLGLALGIGAEVFGARGLGAPRDSDEEGDLSALQPKPSKASARKAARRALTGARPPLPPPPPRPPVPASLLEALGMKGGKRGAGRSKKERKQQRAAAASDAAWRAAAGPAAAAALPPAGGEYGGFERHTTGIGSKLLSKWGFGGAGAGLGREGEGRAEPVEARQRAKGLGLGA